MRLKNLQQFASFLKKERNMDRISVDKERLYDLIQFVLGQKVQRKRGSWILNHIYRELFIMYEGAS